MNQPHLTHISPTRALHEYQAAHILTEHAPPTQINDRKIGLYIVFIYGVFVEHHIYRSGNGVIDIIG